MPQDLKANGISMIWKDGTAVGRGNRSDLKDIILNVSYSCRKLGASRFWTNK